MRDINDYINNPDSIYGDPSLAVKEPKVEQGTAGDLVDLFEAGAYRGVGGLMDFVGADGLADKAYAAADSQNETLSDGMIEAMKKPIFVSDDSSPLGFSAGDGMNWQTVGGNLAQLAGMQAGVPIPGALAARAAARGVMGVSAAVKGVKSDKTLSPVEKAKKISEIEKSTDATKAGYIGTAAAGGVTGGMAGGMSGQNVYDQVMAADLDQLLTVPEFKETVRSVANQNAGMDAKSIFDLARETHAKSSEISRTYDPIAFGVNATLGAVGDAAILKGITGPALSKTVVGATAKGATIEGGTEFFQEGTDQYRTNVVLADAVDPTLDPMTDVLSNAATGAFLGGAMGGGFGLGGRVINGKPPADVPPNPEDVPPSPEDVPPGPDDTPPSPEDVPPSSDDLDVSESVNTGPVPPIDGGDGIDVNELSQAGIDKLNKNAPRGDGTFTPTPRPWQPEYDSEVEGDTELSQAGIDKLNKNGPRDVGAKDTAPRPWQSEYDSEVEGDTALSQAGIDDLNATMPGHLSNSQVDAEKDLRKWQTEDVQEHLGSMDDNRPDTVDSLLDEAKQSAPKYGLGEPSYTDVDTKMVDDTYTPPKKPPSGPSLIEQGVGRTDKTPLILKDGGANDNPRQAKKRAQAKRATKMAIYNRLINDGTVPETVAPADLDAYIEQQIPNPAMREAFLKAQQQDVEPVEPVEQDPFADLDPAEAKLFRDYYAERDALNEREKAEGRKEQKEYKELVRQQDLGDETALMKLVGLGDRSEQRRKRYHKENMKLEKDLFRRMKPEPAQTPPIQPEPKTEPEQEQLVDIEQEYERELAVLDASFDKQERRLTSDWWDEQDGTPTHESKEQLASSKSQLDRKRRKAIADLDYRFHPPEVVEPAKKEPEPTTQPEPKTEPESVLFGYPQQLRQKMVEARKGKYRSLTSGELLKKLNTIQSKFNTSQEDATTAFETAVADIDKIQHRYGKSKLSPDKAAEAARLSHEQSLREGNVPSDIAAFNSFAKERELSASETLDELGWHSSGLPKVEFKRRASAIIESDGQQELGSDLYRKIYPDRVADGSMQAEFDSRKSQSEKDADALAAQEQADRDAAQEAVFNERRAQIDIDAKAKAKADAEQRQLEERGETSSMPDADRSVLPGDANDLSPVTVGDVITHYDFEGSVEIIKVNNDGSVRIKHLDFDGLELGYQATDLEEMGYKAESKKPKADNTTKTPTEPTDKKGSPLPTDDQYKKDGESTIVWGKSNGLKSGFSVLEGEDGKWSAVSYENSAYSGRNGQKLGAFDTKEEATVWGATRALIFVDSVIADIGSVKSRKHHGEMVKAKAKLEKIITDNTPADGVHIEQDGTVEPITDDAIEDSLYEAVAATRGVADSSDVYFEIKPQIDEAIARSKKLDVQGRLDVIDKKIDSLKEQISSSIARGKKYNSSMKAEIEASEQETKMLEERLTAANNAKKSALNYVTFDVKGNGKFKILNTVDRLTRFDKELKAVANGKDSRNPANKHPFKNSSKKQMIEQFEKDGEYDNATQMAFDLGVENYTAPGVEIGENTPRNIYMVYRFGNQASTESRYSFSHHNGNDRPKTMRGEKAYKLGSASIADARSFLTDFAKLPDSKKNTPEKITALFEAHFDNPTPPTPPKGSKSDSAQDTLSDKKRAIAVKLKAAIDKHKGPSMVDGSEEGATNANDTESNSSTTQRPVSTGTVSDDVSDTTATTGSGNDSVSSRGDGEVQNNQSPSVSGATDSTDPDRARGDQRVLDGQGTSTASTAGAEQPAGSSNGDGSGNVAGTGGSGTANNGSDVVREPTLTKQERVEAQRQADAKNITPIPGDIDNIRATLPMLFKEQQEDVEFAEARFLNGGRGTHFANGTGTGKTFTGLGVAKRAYLAGKKNILVVSISQEVINEWVTDAKLMGLPLTQLENTSTHGSGPVITTINNLQSNYHLGGRDWDMVIIDESQRLSEADSFEGTKALRTFRAITGHPRGEQHYNKMQHPVEARQYDRAMSELDDLNALDYDKLTEQQRVKHAALTAKTKSLFNTINSTSFDSATKHKQRWADKTTQVVTLSATPFAYRKSVDMLEGFLFEYDGVEEPGYNGRSPQERFFAENFGYSKKGGKLNQPSGDVNTDFMERQFNERLKESGALRARTLDVPFDFDRRFELIDSGAAQMVDHGREFIREHLSELKDAIRGMSRGSLDAKAMKKRIDSWEQLLVDADSNLTYIRRKMLLEAVKAKAAVPYIKEHLALGRKVVVFHAFNTGFASEEMTYQPFKPAEINLDNREAWNELNALRPDVASYKVEKLANPITTLTNAFGDRAAVYNGTIKKSQGQRVINDFNADGSNADVLIVQQNKGQAGISLHDTTGNHQRVLINIGIPDRPTMFTQIEGRIYRTGQASNAIFRYFTTGLNFENHLFANTIAARAGTADNLALGNDGNSLRDNIAAAYEDAGSFGVGFEQEGIGGKEGQANTTQYSDYDLAKSHYAANQKKTASNKAVEGLDYYPTPEPLGLKMVDWAAIAPHEKALEPSAGHGAISRWLPEHSTNHLIENSQQLFSRAVLNSKTVSKSHPISFEDFGVNNKFNAVVMNPPYNYRGDRSQKMAMDHVAKSFDHLRDGGRIVTIVPSGSAFGKRFDAWLAANKNAHLVGEIKLPSVTFNKAGTGVTTRVLMIDKLDFEVQPEEVGVEHDLTHITQINDLFDEIETLEMPQRTEPLTPSDAEVLDAAGLEVEPLGKKWIVTGNTYKHQKAIKTVAGAKFNRAKQGWVFNSDPSEGIAAALPKPKPKVKKATELTDGMSAEAVLDVALSRITDPAQIAVGEHIRQFLPKTDVLLLSSNVTARKSFPPEAGSANALFWAKNGERTLVLKDKTFKTNSEDGATLLHELLHAVTAEKIDAGNVTANKHLDPKLAGMVKELFKLNNHIVRHINDRKVTYADLLESKQMRSALSDPKELIAYAFSDPRMQDVLLGIPYQNETAWTKFVKTIANIIGLDKTQNTAFSELLRITDDIVQHNVNFGNETIQKQDVESESESESESLSAADSFRKKSWNEKPDKGLMAKLKKGAEAFNETGLRGLAAVMLDGTLIGIRQRYFDRYDAIKKLEAINGIDAINTPELSPWVRARLSGASTSALSVFLTYGRLKWGSDGVTLDSIKTKEGEPNGFSDIIESLGTDTEVKSFFQWIAANRAHDLAVAEEMRREAYLDALQDGEPDRYQPRYTELLFTEDEISAGMDFNKGQMGDGRSREAVFEDALTKFNLYHSDILTIAEEAGVISESSREAWENQFYVPFFREVSEKDDGMDNVAAIMSNGLSKRDVIKRIRGSEKGLGNLLENYIVNTERLLNASLKNRAAQHTIELGMETGLVQRVGKVRDKKRSTYIMEDGQRVHYQFDTDQELTSADGSLSVTGAALFESINALNPIGLDSKAMVAMRTFKRVFTSFTTASPAFMLRNMARDSVMSAAMEKGGGHVLDGIKAYGIGNKMNPLRARMLASGGAFSFGHVYGEQADEIMASVRGELSSIPVLNNSGAIKRAIRAWQGYSDSFENVNRAAVFNANLDQGLASAAFKSRDLLDFSAQGSGKSARFFISVVPFLNARAQGGDKLYRHGTHAQKRARMGIVVGALVTASMLLHSENMDDEDYKKLPNWQRDTYWFLKFGENAVFIPKPFELGAIASMSERAMDQMWGDPEAHAVRDFFFHTLASTFEVNPIPQMFSPAAQVVMNYDIFRGRDIETYGDKRLPPSMVSGRYTSDVAQLTSDGMEAVIGQSALSPKQIDFMIRGYLGFVGVTAVGMADALLSLNNDVPEPTSKWYENSMVRWAYKDLNTPGYTRQQALFYDTLSDYRLHVAAFNELRASGQFGEARQYLAEHRKEILGSKRLEKVQRVISKLRKQEKIILKSETIPAGEKRLLLEQIQHRKNELSSFGVSIN